MGAHKTKRSKTVLAVVLISMTAIPLLTALTLGLFMLFDSPNRARWEKAKSEMGEIAKALNMHLDDHGAYPATLKGVAPNFGGKLPVDPWTRQPFEYVRTGSGFVLRCLGMDDRPGGAKPPDLDIVYTESGLVVTR